MRIAQIASNYHQVSPETNMAIYSHTAWLSNGLIANGNDVTLFASGDSQSNAKLISVTPQATLSADMSEDMRRYYLHALLSACYKDSEKFDIIHTHLTLLPSFYDRLVKTPTLQVLHTAITAETYELMKQYENQYYVSFSLAQRRKLPELNWVANVYHGIDTNLFNFNPHPQEYLLYLGRITEEKGVHLAIEAAKAAGLQLIIAGHSYPKEGYWHDKIEKMIDGKTVRYVGEANLQAKIEYLQNAKAVLFPSQYEETFGLVMIEAMSCGTPVIGWAKGSVPEVIQDRETGYEVKDVAGMVKAINSINKISRDACRDRAQRLFSTQTMVNNYEKAYLKIIETHREKMKNK